MDAAPVVERALRARRRARTWLLAGGLGVLSSTLCAALVFSLFSAPIQALAVAAWAMVSLGLHGWVAARLWTATRWTRPVLAAYSEARIACEAEDHIALWGEPAVGPTVFSSIRRLCARIDGLAGDRIWLHELTQSARETAARLRLERQALRPMIARRADAERLVDDLDADLEALCTRLVRVLQRLLDEHVDESLAAVDDGLERLRAASEVHRAARPLRVHVYPVR